MAIEREMSEFMKPREAAKMLYIHINTLRRWGDTGVLNQYRLGIRGDRRFLRCDIINHLKQLSENGGNSRTE